MFLLSSSLVSSPSPFTTTSVQRHLSRSQVPPSQASCVSLLLSVSHCDIMLLAAVSASREVKLRLLACPLTCRCGHSQTKPEEAPSFPPSQPVYIQNRRPQQHNSRSHAHVHNLSPTSPRRTRHTNTLYFILNHTRLVSLDSPAQQLTHTRSRTTRKRLTVVTTRELINAIAALNSSHFFSHLLILCPGSGTKKESGSTL